MGRRNGTTAPSTAPPALRVVGLRKPATPIELPSTDDLSREVAIDEASRLLRRTPAPVLVSYLPVLADYASLPEAAGGSGA